MNLEANPTKQELCDLIRQCDDTAGNHVLWVKKNGAVALSTIPEGQTPVEFEEEHPHMQLRWETFLAGNEYVGPDAAEDQEWVAELFDWLLKEWRQAKGKAGVVYVNGV